MAAPVAVVAGGSGVGKTSLLRAICGSDVSKASPEHPWKIDNKYYCADVVLRVHRLGDGSAGTPGDALDAEALVLVVDAGSQASLEAVKTFYGGVDCSDVEVQLLVVNKADLWAGSTAGGRPEWLQEARLWCAEHCVEYVEASSTDRDFDGKLAQEEGDEQGVSRVVAALHAHAWPGSTMKPRGGQAVARSGAAPVSKASTGAAAAAPSSSAAGTSVAAAAAAAAPAASTSAAAAAAAGSVLHLDDLDEDDLEDEGAAGDDGADVARMEKEMAQLDKLFKELSGARQRFAGLPDEERRAAAAELAMRLAAMAGIEGSDSEEEATAAAAPHQQ